MTYRIGKRFTFSASHQLLGLPEGHQCARVHGHNYVVEVELAADSLNDYGFVVDYGDLTTFRQYLDRVLDHRHLNDVVEYQPTAENLARDLYRRAVAAFPETTAVVVRETETTWAEWRP